VIDAARKAAIALARGDALGALAITGALDDADALVIRGVAFAQIGDYEPARAAIAKAVARYEASGDRLGRARAAAALGEVAGAQRDLDEAVHALGEAGRALRELGDVRNAAWSTLCAARLALLAGRMQEAERGLDLVEQDATRAGAAGVLAVVEIARAEACVRALQAADAERSLARAADWCDRADNEIVRREIASLRAALDRTIARVVRGGTSIEANARSLAPILAPDGRDFVVDALRRRVVVRGEAFADLESRPVLFTLLEAIARAHPDAASVDELAAEVFGARRPNESHARRLAVEIGRLRAALGDRARIVAARRAFRLEIDPALEVVVVEPLERGDAATLRALLGDGAAWSSQSLAHATATSPRTVQRALRDLVESGEVEAIGRGPSRRYANKSASHAIATQMLLLGLAPRA